MPFTDSDVLATAEAWKRAGRRLALATVIETVGSAPRRFGAHLVIDSEGNFEGSVSGGCVEGDGLDRHTALACLTRDPKIDDSALDVALRAECGYIGALGSAKSHARRLERLAERGFSPRILAKIHAPIGLDIGAATPAEIAVSILAEIITEWRVKPLRGEARATSGDGQGVKPGPVINCERRGLLLP